MAEAQSVTTFVMEAQLPWPDDAPAADALGSLDPVIALRRRAAAPVRDPQNLGARHDHQGRGDAGAGRGGGGRAGDRPAARRDDRLGRWRGGRNSLQAADRHAGAAQPHAGQPAGRAPDDAAVELRCGVGIKWGINLAAGDPAQHLGTGPAGRRRRLAAAGHLRFAVHRRPDRAGRRGGVEQGQSRRHRVDATS